MEFTGIVLKNKKKAEFDLLVMDVVDALEKAGYIYEFDRGNSSSKESPCLAIHVQEGSTFRNREGRTFSIFVYGIELLELERRLAAGEWMPVMDLQDFSACRDMVLHFLNAYMELNNGDLFFDGGVCYRSFEIHRMDLECTEGEWITNRKELTGV